MTDLFIILSQLLYYYPACPANCMQCSQSGGTKMCTVCDYDNYAFNDQQHCISKFTSYFWWRCFTKLPRSKMIVLSTCSLSTLIFNNIILRIIIMAVLILVCSTLAVSNCMHCTDTDASGTSACLQCAPTYTLSDDGTECKGMRYIQVHTPHYCNQMVVIY